MEKKPEENQFTKSRELMANERTFLAWVRTSIAVMAFGFVVEKFTLFMGQIARILGKEELIHKTPLPTGGYFAHVGTFLVAVGSLIVLGAFLNYKRVERQIEKDQYKQSSLLSMLLTIIIVLLGIILFFYLISSWH